MKRKTRVKRTKTLPGRNYRKKRRVFLFRFVRCAAVLVTFLASYGTLQKAIPAIRIPGCQLNRVKLEGCGHLTLQGILKCAGITRDCDMLKLDLGHISSAIAGDSRVREVFVSRNFFTRILSVRVRMREVAAFINCTALYGIDKTGIVLGRMEELPECDVPVINGLKISSISVGDKLSGRNTELALNILNEVTSLNLERYFVISEINIENPRNVVIYSSGQNLEIKLGRRHFSERMKKLEPLLLDLEKKDIKARCIDLRFSGKAVVQPF